MSDSKNVNSKDRPAPPAGWAHRLPPMSFGAQCERAPSSRIADFALLQAAIERGAVMRHLTAHGVAPSAAAAMELVQGTGARLCYLHEYGSGGPTHSVEAAYAWTDGFGVLECSADGSVTFRATLLDAASHKALDEGFRALLRPPPEAARPRGADIHAMVRRGDECRVQRVGSVDAPLVRENYAPDVLAAYDAAVVDLRAADPTGRITLLDGPPGVGKTFILRALALDAPDATFVLVPPHIVAELTGPDLLPMLLDAREHRDGPVVLVLEDADEVVAPRRSKNMSGLSTLLAMGDGFTGELFDLRVLATTNAQLAEIDPALLRPGRMSQRIHVDLLPPAQANAVYRRLVGGALLPFQTPASLGEVYRASRRDGWKPPPRAAAPEPDGPDGRFAP